MKEKESGLGGGKRKGWGRDSSRAREMVEGEGEEHRWGWHALLRQSLEALCVCVCVCVCVC